MSAFSALESRLSSVTLAKLANVTVTVDGIDHPGIFDDRPAEAFGIVKGSKCSLTVSTEVVVSEGSAVVISSVAYTVNDISDEFGHRVLSLEVSE